MKEYEIIVKNTYTDKWEPITVKLKEQLLGVSHGCLVIIEGEQGLILEGWAPGQWLKFKKITTTEEEKSASVGYL